jgi:hypothetical protein
VELMLFLNVWRELYNVLVILHSDIYALVDDVIRFLFSNEVNSNPPSNTASICSFIVIL